ncbi:unnamed protein product, partial [Amoebophrya sp. A25]
RRVRRRLRRALDLPDLDLDLDLAMPELDLSEFFFDDARYQNPFQQLNKARARTEKTLGDIERAIQGVEALMSTEEEEGEGTKEKQVKDAKV